MYLRVKKMLTLKTAQKYVEHFIHINLTHMKYFQIGSSHKEQIKKSVFRDHFILGKV